MKKKMIGSLTLGMLFALSYNGFSQGLNMTEWKVLSEDNQSVELTDTVFLGKPCVKLDGKIKTAMWNKSMNLKNFRLDLDISGAVMSGIGFHVADDQNYQFIYFRPGYGGTGEAVQYIPIYNGALSWVFSGKYQSNADIKKLEWFHAAIVVRGNNLKVFTNYSNKPVMDIMMQNTSSEKGSILLRTMFGLSYFANVTIKEIPEVVTDWEISEQMPGNTTYDYSQVKKVKTWTKINEPGDDYVNLCRYFKYPNGSLVARHVFHRDADEMALLSFDFAGKLQILLNGKEVFNYNKFKLDRVEEGTNRIMLNLKKGDNELIFLTEGDSYLFGNGKGYNSLGRLQHQNWGFIVSINKLGS